MRKLGSSTTDNRIPIEKEAKKKILNLVYERKHFTAQQIVDDSGLPLNIVNQFLQDLCYQGILIYPCGEYKLAGKAENSFI